MCGNVYTRMYTNTGRSLKRNNNTKTLEDLVQRSDFARETDRNIFQMVGVTKERVRGVQSSANKQSVLKPKPGNVGR